MVEEEEAILNFSKLFEQSSERNPRIVRYTAILEFQKENWI